MPAVCILQMRLCCTDGDRWQGGAGKVASSGKLLRNRCSSSSCSPAPLSPLPLLSPRSQNFKPTQNVDPFFQRGTLRQAHKAEAASRSWELEKHLSCTFPVLPTLCSPLPFPRWGISVLTSFPNFSRSRTLSLMSHVAQ